MSRSHGLLLLGLLVLVKGCASAPENLPECTPSNSPGSICGLMNPEDIDSLPGGAWIVVSQMAHARSDAEPGAPPDPPGNLLAIRTLDDMRVSLFPAPDGRASEASAGGGPAADWGESSCSGPPDPARFLPHGIAVGRHASGAPLLAVVNHGGREAVELFEIGMALRPSLVWRGCVPMPEGMMANDLALFADGGFVVTKFAPPMDRMGPSTLWTGIKILAGWNTGAVYRWTPGGGIVELANSAGSAPNGIAISPDESEIFVSEWGAAKIYRLRLDAEGAAARTEVELEHSPDNLTWTRKGRLLAAAQGGGVGAAIDCGQIERGSCALDYTIYVVNPVSLEATPLLTGKGAASVALEVDEAIYVGSFSGDQIQRVAKPD